MVQVNNSENVNKRFSKKIVWLLFIALCSSITLSAQAQKVALEGRVTDSKGNSLIGVGVRTVGAKKDAAAAAETDIDGNFALQTSFPVTLEFTYTGFKKEDVDIYEAPAGQLVIILKEEQNLLDEVVVVGYAVQKRGTIASATSTIGAGQIANTVSPTLSGKLQGEVAGLNISSASGVPGTSSTIRLRGTTSINADNNPLYIIDGVQVSTVSLQQRGLGGQQIDPLADLNPDDVESITVLKDASATAAYGAKGANGVILVTTKRGKQGSKTQVKFGTELGLSRAENLWEITTGPEHAAIVNEAYKNDGRWEQRPFRPADSDTKNIALGNPEDQKTYDRLDEIFRTALGQKYLLSVSGGSDKTNFFLGGEINKQQSTLKMQEFNRNSFRLNLDHAINKKLKIGTSNTFSLTKREVVQVGDGPAGLFQAALHTPTFYPIFKEDGSYNKPVAFDNPIAIIEHTDGWTYGTRIINNVFARYEITKGLFFKSSWSNDRNQYHEKFYFDTYLNAGSGSNGAANDNLRTSNLFSAEQTLNYLQTFREKHNISAFLGNSYQTKNTESTTLTGTQFPSNEFRRITSAAVTSGSSSGSQSSLLSFFGGANYSYSNRYSIDFTLRADGSSRVSADNRWGYFPAVGAAWNIFNEAFFPKHVGFSDVRLKGSFGFSGNDAIGDFASLGLWEGGASYDGQAGIAPYQLANPDLKWETTRQWNVGLATGFLKNRIIVEFDVYNKYTYDLLLAESLPGKTGLSSITKNTGEISNKGWELLINSTNIKKRDFSWKTIATASHNSNKIEKMKTATTGSYGMYRVEEGQPLYSFWVWEYLGVDPATGDAVYTDVNGDGKLNDEDKKFMGNAWAKVEGTLKNTLSYKNWSLDFNFYVRSGNKLFNYTRMFLESGGTNGVARSIQASNNNYWKEEDKDSYKVGDDGLLHDVLPRPKTTANAGGLGNYERQTSRMVEDGSFIRLRNITVAYTLPKRWTRQVGIQQASVYATAANLFLWSKYSGPDPEVNIDSDSRGLVQGLDFGTPPQPRSFVAGINLTF
ncbi:MAG: TonB-dependent receptor [Bacteroidales bacterium]|jgi:TonB-linked SusC/RagA family outer membrane protein|nr:TonB-dependent receptor [Bacteroidales bacterium]